VWTVTTHLLELDSIRKYVYIAIICTYLFNWSIDKFAAFRIGTNLVLCLIYENVNNAK